MTTKLEAVNEMLEGLGEPPVDQLDTGGVSIEAEAEAILDRERRRVLGAGPAKLGAWHSTLLDRKRFSFDVGSPYPAPDFTEFIYVRWASHPYKRVAIRDGVLYDMDEDQVINTGEVVLDVALDRPFEDLSPRLKDYVVASASVAFQRAKKRGREDDAFLRDKLRGAKVHAMQEDFELSRLNVLGTPTEQRILGNRYGYYGWGVG